MITENHAGKSKTRRSFSQYDNRRFVVLLPDHVASGPLLGTAHFEHDAELGDVLRIALDGSQLGNPHIVLTEDGFSGLILPDDRYGCDFCVFAG
jgi:hypothetical protein